MIIFMNAPAPARTAVFVSLSPVCIRCRLRTDTQDAFQRGTHVHSWYESQPRCMHAHPPRHHAAVAAGLGLWPGPGTAAAR